MGEVLLDELMSCWTECAPGQLAAGPELTAVQCMEATLQCLDLLLHRLPSLFPKGGLLLPLPCMIFHYDTWHTPLPCRHVLAPIPCASSGECVLQMCTCIFQLSAVPGWLTITLHVCGGSLYVLQDPHALCSCMGGSVSSGAVASCGQKAVIANA